MLNVFFYGIITAIITTAIIIGAGMLMGLDFPGVGRILISFLIQSVCIIIILYAKCIEQTPLAIIRWLWPGLIINAIFLLISDEIEEEFGVISVILAVISGIFCITTLFAPKQNMVYIHDMQEVDIAYTISSDEILARMDLKIDNSSFSRDKYEMVAPEMRKIAGKDVAVYQIHNKRAREISTQTEYIPGYAIKEVNQLPEFITKRIYFDTSYIFQRDALRRVRIEYPTFIIGNHKFDVDDEWNPYEIFEYREKMYSSNGNDYGLIIVDLRDGTCEQYKADEVPEWVDFKTTEPK